MDSTRGVRIALEGCGHGKLHDIYAKVKESATAKGWDGVDLVIIGGDFQSVRNSNDLNGMSVPTHYRQIGDFHEYYSGKAIAPYLTLFIGGNHEASNYLFELYYGGWVAPNIYYMGAANVLRFGPLRIAGLSGIWKGYDYQKPHFERLPYNEDDVKTIYHVRELDVRKLLQVRTQVDMGLSHDWPRGVELCGNYNHLFKVKPFFRQDSETGKLGSIAAKYVMDRLRPPYWFSAHLHVRYTALVTHAEYQHYKADQSTNKRKVWTAQGMDGTTDEVRESPATRSGAFSVPQRPVPAQAIQAWNNFSVVATEQAEVDHAEFLKQQSQKDENLSLNLESISSTFKQVTADNFGRKILKTETSVAQEPLVVKNSDEIDLDLDSENEWVRAADEATKVDQENADNSVDAAHQTEMQVAGETQQPDQGSKEEPSQEASVTTEKSDIVPEAIRSQLPDAFKRPIHEKPVFGSLPEAIQNKVTNFLALGKCEDKVACHEYIDLMEVFAHNEDLDTKPPFSLQYDKEWLAITRVFADSLELGNPKAQLPSDQGDENYKAQIEKEEEWVQEHIVDKGKLVIPHNFEMTAPVYDPNVPIQTLEMPQEYSNPQTSAFCELLDIKNSFHQSPSEREQRMLAGPRPSRGSTGHSRWQRRGANNGGGRGRGGRGRGRGGRGGSFH